MARRAYNSTIKIREDRACIICGKPCVWFSRKRCQQCAKIQDNKDAPEEEVEDLSGLIQDADTIFSKWIRYKDADENKENVCYTCDKRMPASQLQNGHYIPRTHMATRYLEENCRCQCVTCNEVKRGNLAEYGKRLERDSPGITEWLLEQSRSVYKISREELRTIINEYTLKLKALK